MSVCLPHATETCFHPIEKLPMEDLDVQVLRAALAWCSAGVSAVLITVAHTWGSSPRPPGSLMVINNLGEAVGSVSGGCIEDDLVERIRTGGVLAVCINGRPTVHRYGISADEAHRFGLPCGGTVELVLEPVTQDSRLDELLRACLQRRSLARVLNLRSGHVELQPGYPGSSPQLSESDLRTVFGPSARLILIGAGDIALFMSEIALSLGFQVIVCDPREAQRKAWPLQRVQLSHEMPDDLILRIKPDTRTAVVALTHDPKLDDLSLIDSLQSEAFYVGAIGSRRNSELRRERLRVHFGLSEDILDRLHSPAGLYIGGKTPAEIALSIMAEVVAAKNGVRKRLVISVAEGKAAQSTSYESTLGTRVSEF